jgi:hypothetical protein
VVSIKARKSLLLALKAHGSARMREAWSSAGVHCVDGVQPGRDARAGLSTAHCLPGYVVHVLSGVIHVQAWRAGLGNYRAGETWVEPAFAYDITVANASATAPARAFVVVTGDDKSERLENTD